MLPLDAAKINNSMLLRSTDWMMLLAPKQLS
jgi:hypothetical protein